MTNQIDPITQKNIENVRKNARYIVWFGSFLFLFGFVLMVLLGQSVLELMGGAQAMTIQEAVDVAHDDATYARVGDIVWQCDSITHTRGLWGRDFRRRTYPSDLRTGYTEVVATSADRRIAMLVTLSGELTCDDLTDDAHEGFLRSGVNFSGLNTRTNAYLNNADTALILCGYCGLENSAIGLGMGTFVTLSGLLLIYLGRVFKA